MSSKDNFIIKDIQHLVQLQKLAKQTDVIERQIGDLPQIVAKIQAEIDAFEVKQDNARKRIEEHQQAIQKQEEEKKAHEILVVQYEKKHQKAKNDQEYGAIGQQLELSKLDVLLGQKRIREYRQIIAQEEEKIVALQGQIAEAKVLLAEKSKTLEELVAMNKSEQDELEQQKEKIRRLLQPQSWRRYDNLRNHGKRSAIVDIVDGACMGCHTLVRPQKQQEVKQQDKLRSCEVCGRLFAYVIETVKETVKPKRRRRLSTAS